MAFIIYTITCSTLNIEKEGNLRFLTAQLKNTNTTTYLYPKCTSADQCNKGVCDTTTGQCLCDTKYDTFWNNAEIAKNGNMTIYDYTNSTMCDYEKKSQLTSFLLSMFVGFGAEHFYMERIDTAISKLVFYLFCYGLNIVYFIVWIFIPSKKHLIQFIGTYEAIYLSCGVVFIVLWNVYDWVNIGYNIFLDGNSMPLLSWNTTQS
jgi:hypothetical protein